VVEIFDPLEIVQEGILTRNRGFKKGEIGGVGKVISGLLLTSSLETFILDEDIFGDGKKPVLLSWENPNSR
jgi:hypothetical protein